MDDPKSPYSNHVVNIDSYILPPWAINNHHFVFMNSMALESDIVRERINNWIDLVFGIDQQNYEKYNLFKPLTDEVF